MIYKKKNIRILWGERKFRLVKSLNSVLSYVTYIYIFMYACETEFEYTESELNRRSAGVCVCVVVRGLFKFD